MAHAYFVNASPVTISVNLNNNLEQNYVLDTFSPGSLDDDNQTIITYNTWAAEIEAFPSTDVFGGDDALNTLVVFRTGTTTPVIYDIQSSVSTTLDLFFYILGEEIIGVDATGSSDGITISVNESAAFFELGIPVPSFIH